MNMIPKMPSFLGLDLNIDSAADLAVGMSPDVSAIVSGLSAQELRDIAARHGGEVGPRRGDSPELWRALLVAAESNEDPEALWD